MGSPSYSVPSLNQSKALRDSRFLFAPPRRPSRIRATRVLFQRLLMTKSPPQFTLGSLLMLTTVVAFGCAFMRAFGMRGVMLVLIAAVSPVLLVVLCRLYQRLLGALVDFVLRPFLGP